MEPGERDEGSRQKPEVPDAVGWMERGDLAWFEPVVAGDAAPTAGLVVALGLADVPGWYGDGAQRVRLALPISLPRNARHQP